MDGHGGDRQVDAEPRQHQDRVSAPRLRPICCFNKIGRTEIEAGGAAVATGGNRSYGRLRADDVTAGHWKWRISAGFMLW